MVRHITLTYHGATSLVVVHDWTAIREVDPRISASPQWLQKHEGTVQPFAGEGNTTQRMELAEQLKIFLHYKNKGSLNFEVFLT